MPFPFIPTPIYANVPLSPGVPLMLRASGALAFIAPVLQIADALGLTTLLLGPRWGVFDENGAAVVIPDSVYSLDLRTEYRLADYPIEQGGFMSYNKVEVPLEARVRFNVSTDRGGFLDALHEATRSLNLYSIFTPEGGYTSVNITHYDFRREARAGAYLLQVDVWFQRVRILQTGRYVSSTAPVVRGQTNTGTVQALPPTLSNGLLPNMVT